MSELREVLLCLPCLDEHFVDEAHTIDDCGAEGCQCWCREDKSSFWAMSADGRSNKPEAPSHSVVRQSLGPDLAKGE